MEPQGTDGFFIRFKTSNKKVQKNPVMIIWDFEEKNVIQEILEMMETNLSKSKLVFKMIRPPFFYPP